MAGIDLNPQFEAILATDLPEIDKLSKSFVFLISQHIEISRREIELLKVLGDQEAIVKEQIKANTMAYVLSVYEQCHRRVTGRKVADE
jgi:hypothetical protein